MKYLQKILINKKIIIGLIITLSVIAALQSYLPGESYFEATGYNYTQYNNYKIFTHSYYHLINNQDIYQRFEAEHWDLFKYTPTFALFFGFFTLLPDWLGLIIWSLINSLVLVAAIYSLPNINTKYQTLILFIAVFELVTSLQNEQSNALITGLLVFSFVFLEKEKPMLATLVVILSVFIKLFGIVGFVIFIFYPKKLKLFLYALMWTLILLVLPLLVIDPDQYGNLLNSYIKMLGEDHSGSEGYSVMGWLSSWFSLNLNKFYIVLTGAVLLLLPLLKFNNFKDYYFRLLALCSVLIWVVIFNHKAESPTFIIAISGVAIWFIISPKNWINISLFVFAIIFSSLSTTDLFPRVVFNEFVHPYSLKAVPCIFIWFKILYDMFFFKETEYISGENGSLPDSP